MATKQELIDTLSTFDLPTLNRLVSLGSSILLPEDPMLVNVTFEQMLSRCHSIADSAFPEWTDRTKADMGEFLAELFCLFSEKDFWYVNAFAEEGFISKSKEYSNKWLRARELGYTPIPWTNSSASFLLTIQAGSALALNLGDIQIKVNGVPFVNLPITIESSAIMKQYSVPFVQGTVKSLTKNFNGRSVTIQDNGIVLSSIKQSIGGELWTATEFLADLDSTSKNYIIVPTSFGAEILYGDGTYGITPTVGNPIITDYISCSGSQGNILKDDVSSISITKNIARTISSVEIPADITGGRDIESGISILKHTTITLKTSGYLGGPEEVKTWILNAYPDVLKVTVQTLFNDIYFRIIRSGNNQPSMGDLSAIASEVQKHLPPFGYQSFGVQNVFVNISEVSITPYFLPGSDTVTGTQKIKDYLLSICNPQLGAEYGKSFILVDILSYCLDHVAGLSNIVFHTVNGISAANIDVRDTEMLSGLTSDHITIV